MGLSWVKNSLAAGGMKPSKGTKDDSYLKWIWSIIGGDAAGFFPTFDTVQQRHAKDLLMYEEQTGISPPKTNSAKESHKPT